jgi:uncharacterized membrane protein
MTPLFTIGLIVAILVIAAVGLYLYTRSHSENPVRSPRAPAYVERRTSMAGASLC